MSKEPEYMNAISGLIQYFVVGWQTKQFDYEKAFNIVEQALEELEELKKSDESKEQSSIDYYNEMRKYKRELNELKSKVGNFIDKHMAYPYGENGELFDDEYTKDYEELLKLCKGSEE